MHRTINRTFLAAAVLLLLIYLAPGFAQDASNRSDDPPQTTQQQPADAGPEAPGDGDAQQPSADDVLQDLLRRRAENPLIDPARSQSESGAEDRRSPAARAVAGIAPGAAEAQLRREGQFVITRRGRMVRAPGDISGWVFVFDADASGMHEPPMYLMPCQLLEDMEQIVQEHGDTMVFVISGQIYLYRGANYLLPTLMQLAPDRGNIHP